MNRKNLTIAGAVVLIAGAGFLIATHKSPDAAAAGRQDAAEPAKAAHQASNAAADDAALKAKARKDREIARNAELVSKYGESRTNLSRKIVGDVAGLLDDAASMGEMVTSGEAANAFGGPDARLRRGLGGLYGKLELNDDQKEKIIAIYTDFQKRQVDKTRSTIDDLKKDPSTLMSLFLAGDAYKRGDMTEADYQNYQKDNSAELQQVINPLDEKNLRGQPLRDPAFLTAMDGMLEPAQKETLQAAVAEDKAGDTGHQTDISNLPAMELDKLDTTVTSARKFTSGIKSMMEGAGGLEGFKAMMDQQKKPQPK